MKTSIRLFHWLPRIICILAILFVSMFAADSFAPGHSIWQQIGAFFIHLIPSFILLALLIAAWKWELIGGVIFIILGLVLSPFIFMLNYNKNHSVGISLGVILMVTFPFIVAGILFIISHLMKKKIHIKTHKDPDIFGNHRESMLNNTPSGDYSIHLP